MLTSKKINNNIQELKKVDSKDAKKISDGYHTFEGLYYQRMLLTLALSLAAQDIFETDLVYRSKKHDDGTMFDESFIVWFQTPEGPYSYHYNTKYWELFDNLPEKDFADPYDGHTEEDVTRLVELFRFN